MCRFLRASCSFALQNKTEEYPALKLLIYSFVSQVFLKTKRNFD